MQHKRLNAVLDQQKVLTANRSRRHGEVAALYAQADGKCQICGAPRGARNHALDHCHSTNKLRGILCTKCNIGLGYFDDDIERLRAAIQYLEKNS